MTSQPSTNVSHVVVIGGGVAGIAAAVRLAERGVRVTLIEARQRLGGRASSFDDPKTGEEIDNCQHITLGCCTYLDDLYGKLGVRYCIEWRRRFHFVDAQGAVKTLRASRLPAPLHFLPSAARMSHFIWREKWRLARAMWRLLRTAPEDVDDLTFGALLRRWKQPDRLVRRFWNVFIVSTCNLDVERVGARYAVKVFREGFLAGARAASMGVPTVPLSELYGSAADVIGRTGGEVRLGVRVEQVRVDRDRVIGVATSAGDLQADAVVLAVPHEQLHRLVDDSLLRRDTRFSHLPALGASPIVGVHLWFEREVMSLAHMTLLDHETQWLFNRGIDADDRQHIHAVISGADTYAAMDVEQVVASVVRDLGAALPGRGVEEALVRHRVIKERRATFAATPSLEAKRPIATGLVGNLYLAGDFCQTGWPATMESAARSGYQAANALLGLEDSDLPAELRPGLLYRLLTLGTNRRR